MGLDGTWAIGIEKGIQVSLENCSHWLINAFPDDDSMFLQYVRRQNHPYNP